RERERLVGLRGRLPFFRRGAGTACIGGAPARPAPCSPQRSRARLLPATGGQRSTLLGGFLMSNERYYDTERLPDTNSSNLAENLDRRNFLKTAAGGSAAVAMTLAGTAGAAENLHARVPAEDLPVDENIGDLEAVASFNQQVVGVAVSASGRVFVSFPRNGIDTVKKSVAEVIDGKAVVYPNRELNTLDTRAPSTHFLSVQSVYVDANDTLWCLDVGNLGSGTALVPGGAKLVA